ncbi:MAG: transposase, partial [Treponema sp.]|nr:transposase [Treponema sp.]
MKSPIRGILEAVTCACESGCKWRASPAERGKWRVIYVRSNRRAKKGVLERGFMAVGGARLIGRAVGAA